MPFPKPLLVREAEPWESAPVIASRPLVRLVCQRQIAPLLVCEPPAIQRQPAPGTRLYCERIAQTFPCLCRGRREGKSEVQSVSLEPVIAVRVLPLVQESPVPVLEAR